MLNLHSILLIAQSKESRSIIADLIGECRRSLEISALPVLLPDGLQLLHSFSDPQVAILEVCSLAQGIRDISALLAVHPRTTILATTVEKRSDWRGTLIGAGAEEQLTTPTTCGELEGVLKQATRLFELKQGAAVAGGTIITVYNPAGGVGTTTMAVNLAASLAAREESTALIDLNPFSNDVTTFLDLTPAETVAGLLESEHCVTQGELQRVMTHHASGVRVLCGPDEVARESTAAPDVLPNILSSLRGQFNFTIIDSGGSLSRRNLELFDASDVILYPLLQTQAAVSTADRYLKALKSRGVGPDRVKVVVNRYDSNEQLGVAVLEKKLGVAIFHAIPNSYREVNSSINKGTPLVTSYPRSSVARAFAELTARLTTPLPDRSPLKKMVFATPPLLRGFFAGAGGGRLREQRI